MKTVFITGGTGHIGSRLIRKLIERGITVKALIRKGSMSKLPTGCEVITVNVFDAITFEKYISSSDIFVQLLGVPHPSPPKKKLFKTIDLASVKESVKPVSL
ncbi:MAG: NAD(P)H-binding protein [Bacteroidota bacterium]